MITVRFEIGYKFCTAALFRLTGSLRSGSRGAVELQAYN